MPLQVFLRFWPWLCISKSENHEDKSDMLDKIEIYYIKWNLLFSSFRWQWYVWMFNHFNENQSTNNDIWLKNVEKRTICVWSIYNVLLSSASISIRMFEMCMKYVKHLGPQFVSSVFIIEYGFASLHLVILAWVMNMGLQLCFFFLL